MTTMRVDRVDSRSDVELAREIADRAGRLLFSIRAGGAPAPTRARGDREAVDDPACVASRVGVVDPVDGTREVGRERLRTNQAFAAGMVS